MQAALSLTAAAVFAYRIVAELVGRGVPDARDPSTTGVSLGIAALVLALGGAAVARRPRLAAALLIGALALELTVLGEHLAPPRLVAALPLIGALALALTARGRSDSSGAAATQATTRARAALTVVAFALMVPIGFFYLTTGLVAPAPDVFLAYALFAVLVTTAVLLARRRSWWVLAVPPVSAGLWFLLLWVGESLWGWSA